MGKVQKATRLPKDQAERVEEYAEERDITEADALRRLVRIGLDEEEGGPIITDGGQYLRPDEHPWIDPLIRIGDRFSFYGTVLITLAFTLPLVPTISVWLFGIAPTTETVALFFSLATLLGVPGLVFGGLSLVSLLTLEYLMHPAEAPFRRYFPRTWPDHENETTEAAS
jgi:hypothetical protein